MGTGTILLVEDEEALLKLTAERLTECGYTVLPARDGIHALEIARSFNETHPSPPDGYHDAQNGWLVVGTLHVRIAAGNPRRVHDRPCGTGILLS